MSESPSPTNFVRILAPALRQAAAIASALEGRVINRPKTGEVRPAKAALTTADTASQEAILVPLWEHFPNVCLEAEEDTESAHLFPEESVAKVVVDPIDGTLHSYLAGRGPYAVMVGLLVAGTYQAALVALPREEILSHAVLGGGARVARGRVPAEEAILDRSGRQVFVSHEMPDSVLARLVERGYEPLPACGGAISIAPLVPGVCAGLRIGVGGQGISIRGRIGALIADEAGCLVRKEGNAPFPRDIDSPAQALMVAADEEDLRSLEFALESAGIS